jgi:hypothetical protein
MGRRDSDLRGADSRNQRTAAYHWGLTRRAQMISGLIAARRGGRLKSYFHESVY